MDTPKSLPNQVTLVAITETVLGESDTVENIQNVSQEKRGKQLDNANKKAEAFAKVLFWVACVALVASASYWISEIISTYR